MKPKEEIKISEPIPIPVWAERAEIISELIDLKVHEMCLSKKIGFPFQPISDEWVAMAAKKLNAAPSLIRNEIEMKIKQLEED